MTELAMRREGNALVAVDEISADELKSVPLKQDVLVTIKMPRNVRQFRLAWALADKVANGCDWLHDRDDAMSWLKIKARHVRFLADPRTGQTAIVPKSIAFASLSQSSFTRVFNRMIYIVCSEIIPGLKESDLRHELLAMVGVEKKT